MSVWVQTLKYKALVRKLQCCVHLYESVHLNQENQTCNPDSSDLELAEFFLSGCEHICEL